MWMFSCIYNQVSSKTGFATGAKPKPARQGEVWGGCWTRTQFMMDFHIISIDYDIKTYEIYLP